MSNVIKLDGVDGYFSVPSPGQRDFAARAQDVDATLVSVSACTRHGSHVMDAAQAAKLREDNPEEFKVRLDAVKAAMAGKPVYSGPVRKGKGGDSEQSEG